MAEGRSRAAWGHTAAVMALIANVHRDAKRRPTPYAARDFNPYGQADGARRNASLPKVKISSLKDVIMGAFGGGRESRLTSTGTSHTPGIATGHPRA